MNPRIIVLCSLILLFIIVIVLSAGNIVNIAISAKDALNWLGIVITVFSLLITAFIAFIALEAVNYINRLRGQVEEFEKIKSNLNDEHNRILRAKSNTVQYLRDTSSFLTRIIDTLMDEQSSSDKAKQFADVKTSLEAQLAVYIVSMADDDTLEGREDIIAQAFVILQFGRPSDCEYLLSRMDKLDFKGKNGLRKKLMGKILAKET